MLSKSHSDLAGMPESNHPISKFCSASIRRRVKSKRNSISTAEQAKAAFWVALRIARHPCFRRAKSFTAYIAANGELSLAPLIRLGQQQGKTCFLPKISGQGMGFHSFPKGAKLYRNRYNLMEPSSLKGTLNLAKVNLILCPLVAFDRHGNRLGMGGGFYDKALSKLKDNRKLKVWGVGHDCQEVPLMQPQTWDIAMDGIFTPSQAITTKTAKKMS